MPDTYRFVCNTWPAYRIILARENRILQFQDGVLDTDEAGAAVIRAHELYRAGRFRDGDPEAPAHGPMPEGAPHAIPNAVPSSPYCGICDQMFNRMQDLKAHNTRKHGGGS